MSGARSSGESRILLPNVFLRSARTSDVSGKSVFALMVPPPGIEPGSQPSEGRILSVEIQREWF